MNDTSGSNNKDSDAKDVLGKGEAAGDIIAFGRSPYRRYETTDDGEDTQEDQKIA